MAVDSDFDRLLERYWAPREERESKRGELGIAEYVVTVKECKTRRSTNQPQVIAVHMSIWRCLELRMDRDNVQIPVDLNK